MTKITWQGKEYTYNQSIRNILFIGVDKKEEMQIQDYAGRGGQADCLILLSLNTREKTATMLNLSLIHISRSPVEGGFFTEDAEKIQWEKNTFDQLIDMHKNKKGNISDLKKFWENLLI